jgi:hypothetical protein
MIFNHKKKNKKKLHEAFGKAKSDSFDFKQIEIFFRKKDHSDSFQTLSDKTCTDLDFKELFMFLDRTNSKVGQQYLYNKLRTIPSCSTGSDLQEKLIARFIADPDFRVSVQYQLSELNAQESFYIASLFQDELLKPPKWFFIVRLLSFTSVLSMGMLFFNPAMFFVLLVVFIVNIGFHFENKRNLNHYYSSIPQLLKLNEVAGNLFKETYLKEMNPGLVASIQTLNKVSAHVFL